MVGRVIAGFVPAPTSAIPRLPESQADMISPVEVETIDTNLQTMTRGPNHSHLKAWTATVQAGALQRGFNGAATHVNCDVSR